MLFHQGVKGCTRVKWSPLDPAVRKPLIHRQNQERFRFYALASEGLTKKVRLPIGSCRNIDFDPRQVMLNLRNRFVRYRNLSIDV